VNRTNQAYLVLLETYVHVVCVRSTQAATCADRTQLGLRRLLTM
jgi:hypothetical protein